jgi:MmyB-like transcription regulator ligand binding domain
VHDLWAPDPAFIELSTRLHVNCPEFDSWWDQHDVVASGTGRKMLHHPRRGVLAYDYATFQANEDPAVKLTIYTQAPHDS